MRFLTINIASCPDYYPFGMAMRGRNGSVESYRYGFNGMEKDDEVKGSGNHLDFGARMYDPRLGRWLSIDGLARQYPALSPYDFVDNSPLRFIDPDGNRIIDANGNRVKVKVKKNGDLTYSKTEVLGDKVTAQFEIMAQTKSGRKLIRQMNRNFRKVHIKIDNDKITYSIPEVKKFPGYKRITKKAVKNGKLTETQSIDDNYKIAQQGVNYRGDVNGKSAKIAEIHVGSIKAIVNGDVNPSPYSDPHDENSFEEKVAITTYHEASEAIHPFQGEGKSRRKEDRFAKELLKKQKGQS